MRLKIKNSIEIIKISERKSHSMPTKLTSGESISPAPEKMPSDKSPARISLRGNQRIVQV